MSLQTWPCVGDAVASDPDGIRLSGEFAIRFRDAAIESLGIRPLRPEGAEIARKRLRAFDAMPQAEVKDPFSCRIRNALDAWAKAPSDRDLRELVGLGAGSTPAGDDVLVGILAGLRAFGRPEGLGLSLSDTATATAPPTTIGSIQMLCAAIDGAFPESLCDLVAILGAPEAKETAVGQAVSDLLSLGSTSGEWMLAGLSAVATSAR